MKPSGGITQINAYLNSSSSMTSSASPFMSGREGRFNRLSPSATYDTEEMSTTKHESLQSVTRKCDKVKQVFLLLQRH